MKEKKNGVLFGTIFVIILLILFMLGGFFVGKNISTNKINQNTGNESTGGDTNTSETEKELDIHSRLVQFLYNEVTYDQVEPSWIFGWEFNNLHDNNRRNTDNFYADKADEIYKMVFVGRNLSDAEKKYSYGMNVPASEYGHVDSNDQVYYTKEYIETVYQTIFGKDAKLNTSIPIHIGIYATETYAYDANTNHYYKYVTEGGGTGMTGGYVSQISKAVLKGNELVIYQDVRELDTDKTTELSKFQYAYTFEKEDDGMYKFISREKK